MSRFFFILIASCVGISAFAQMSFGQLMQSYFDTLLPIDHPTYASQDVFYTDVHPSSLLQKSLQKAIYHDLFPNASIDLDTERPATIHDIQVLLGYHFGLTISKNNRLLDTHIYQTMMEPVMESYAFDLIQNLNVDLLEQSKTRIAGIEGFEMLNEVYTELRDHHYYTDTITDKQIIQDAAAGIARAYDDKYTTFLKPAETQDFEEEISGNFVGIGAYVHIDSSGYFIISGTIDGSPARQAGLLPQDRIVQVDDYVIPDYANIGDTVRRIKGVEGTAVELRIKRGSNLLTKTIIRKEVTAPFVRDELLETEEYYINISLMGTESGVQFIRALKRLKESKTNKLIIDVRSNPGGVLDEVRLMLDALTPTPKRVITIGTRDKQRFLYSFHEPIVDLSRYQTVILMDAHSASASEILAASLHEFFPDTITLVGEQTYGKGSAQRIIYLDDGSALKYTFAQWKTGLLRKGIDGLGVQPEYEVSQEGEEDLQLQAAKHILKYAQ